MNKEACEYQSVQIKGNKIEILSRDETCHVTN